MSISKNAFVAGIACLAMWCLFTPCWAYGEVTEITSDNRDQLPFALSVVAHEQMIGSGKQLSFTINIKEKEGGEFPSMGMLEIYEGDDSRRPILQSICLPTDVNGKKLLSQLCISSATHVKHARFSVFGGDTIGSVGPWKYWLDLTAYQANFPQPKEPDFRSQDTNGFRQHGESSVADGPSPLEVPAREQPRPANFEPPPQHPEDVRADEACDAFLKTRDYGAILDTVKSWKQKLNQPAQKEIVIRLMRGLGSTKPTPANEDHVAIAWRVLKRREPRRTPDNRDWTWQDLLIEGGRCAWALERLLEYDLPPIHEALTADERRTAVLEAQARIVRAMDMPQTVNATVLPESERVKVTESERTHPRVLAELANDTSVAVRRAVAANRFTPPRVLKTLYRDPDSEVVERAQKNFLLITPQERPR